MINMITRKTGNILIRKYDIWKNVGKYFFEK